MLGRKIKYRAEIEQLESQWGTLFHLEQQYHQIGVENFAADDAYVQWKWYTDATTLINSQLERYP